MISREKTWNAFVSKTTILLRKLATKQWKTKSASFSSYNISTLIFAFFKRVKRINSKFFRPFTMAIWEKVNSLEIRTKKRTGAVTVNRFKRDIAGKRTSGTYSILRRKQNVSKCWSLMWEKRSTKVLAYHKPEVATFLCNDVENDGYCCFAKMLNFGSKTFKMLEFTFGIDLLLSQTHHFWFSKMHCQILTGKKNAGSNIYVTPKFWHKIQDSEKSVEYLLNRPRVLLRKSFLQL